MAFNVSLWNSRNFWFDSGFQAAILCVVPYFVVDYILLRLCWALHAKMGSSDFLLMESQGQWSVLLCHLSIELFRLSSERGLWIPLPLFLKNCAFRTAEALITSNSLVILISSLLPSWSFSSMKLYHSVSLWGFFSILSYLILTCPLLFHGSPCVHLSPEIESLKLLPMAFSFPFSIVFVNQIHSCNSSYYFCVSLSQNPSLSLTTFLNSKFITV